MTQYVYHMIPHNMQGRILYPLNRMKSLYPEIYAQQIAKYNDHPSRRNLPQRIIPKLNCLWNDVVQCAPIHPRHLYRQLVQHGFELNPDMRWFQIPLETIQDMPVAIYFSQYKEDITLPLPETAVEWFDFDHYQELTTIPADTLAWYDRMQEKGRVFGIFVGIPHILVQGEIDTRHTSVITWGA